MARRRILYRPVSLHCSWSLAEPHSSALHSRHSCRSGTPIPGRATRSVADWCLLCWSVSEALSFYTWREWSCPQVQQRRSTWLSWPATPLSRVVLRFIS